MKKYGYYQYTIQFAEDISWQGWIYEIFTTDKKPKLIRESDEWFDSANEANFAAIGHIGLLENGEG